MAICSSNSVKAPYLKETQSMENIFAKQKEINIGILLFEGVYLLDFAGPMEVFSDLGAIYTDHKINVYTVSYNGYPIKTQTGLVVHPTYAISRCPVPDIFIVPGGKRDISEFNAELKLWITQTTNHSKITLSVCTGAFILAHLGLLDHKDATTWHVALTDLSSVSDLINVVPNIRYTDSGKIVTTAGITAGIDGSFYVIEKAFGRYIANEIALFMEYNYWQLHH